MRRQTSAEERRKSLEADSRKARQQAASFLRAENGGTVKAISRATGVPKSPVSDMKELID